LVGLTPVFWKAHCFPNFFIFCFRWSTVESSRAFLFDDQRDQRWDASLTSTQAYINGIGSFFHWQLWVIHWKSSGNICWRFGAALAFKIRMDFQFPLRGSSEAIQFADPPYTNLNWNRVNKVNTSITNIL
jgi:hypothetical protein